MDYIKIERIFAWYPQSIDDLDWFVRSFMLNLKLFTGGYQLWMIQVILAPNLKTRTHIHEGMY